MDQESTVLNLTVITTVDGNESPIHTTNISAHPINTLQEPVLPPRTHAPNSTILTSQTSQHRRGTSVPTTHIWTKPNNSDSTNYQHRTGTSVATTHVCTKLNNSDSTHYQHRTGISVPTTHACRSKIIICESYQEYTSTVNEH